MRWNTVISAAIIIHLFGCQSKDYSDRREVISKGEKLFIAQCSACHNFERAGIGPALGGVTLETTASWLRGFIRDPAGMIKEEDDRAVRLHEQYSTIMPPFGHLTEEEMDAILAYLHTHPDKPQITSSEGIGQPITDPIPDTVPLSDLVLELKQVAVAPPTSDKKPLARINKMVPIVPGSNRVFISDLNGVLYEMKKDKLTPFLRINDFFPHFIKSPGLGTGLGSFTFHPDYQENGLFYTSHTEDPENAPPADFALPDSIPSTVRWVLTEWKMKDPDASTFSGSHREIIRADMVTGIHGMQEITFDPGAVPGDENYGLLYIGIGDGGAMLKGYTFIPQNKKHIWGNILRIDPAGTNSSNGHYGIPSTNPFSGEMDKGYLGEIYAMGFRNPHRILWATGGDGKMLASNIGQKQVDELDLILPGHNYGWPDREGTFLIDKNGDINNVYPLPEDEASYDYTYPVLQFDHDVAGAISSGYVYYGDQIPGLQGKYFFGGIVNGRIFFTEAKDLKLGKQAPFYEVRLRKGNGPIVSLRDLIGTKGRVDLRFGLDGEGELYLFTKADGKIYKVVKMQK